MTDSLVTVLMRMQTMLIMTFLMKTCATPSMWSIALHAHMLAEPKVKISHLSSIDMKYKLEL